MPPSSSDLSAAADTSNVPDTTVVQAPHTKRSANSGASNVVSQLLAQLQLSDSACEAEAALAELARLSRKPAHRAALMAAASCPSATLAALVARLDTATHSRSAVAAAASLLQNLAADAQHHASILAAGVVQPLVRLASDEVPGSDEGSGYAPLAACVGALSNLASSEAGCAQIAAAPGCMERVVQLLSHASAVVREGAATVVAQAAFEPQLCPAIAAAGAVRPLLSLLSAHTSSDGGRQVAAAALENLTFDNAAIRRSVAEQGAIPLLVGVLSSASSAAAQQSAAGALHNLALAPTNCDSIAAAGAIEPLVGLLERGASQAVQSVAGSTIGKLASANPDARAEIVEVRGKMLELERAAA